MAQVLPGHLAIIMDGNGRWAEDHQLSRTEGHRFGSEKLREVAYWVKDRGIPVFSVYAFSTENWKRPKQEVDALMNLIPEFFDLYGDEFSENKVKVHFAGYLPGLPPEVQRICHEVEERELPDPSFHIYVCLNYGGRDELIRAVRKMLTSPRATELAASLDEETFQSYLYCPNMPDPDLIVRTAGEERLSNFWTWQSVYSELYFTPVYWPDFSEADLDLALADYSQRQRRYGGR